MGWWGQRFYGRLTMREVRDMIERDTAMTVTSLNFRYAVCVVDEKAIAKHEHWRKIREQGTDPLNYIMIALWYKSDDQVMIKQVGEDCGPCELDIPMKYINKPCELMKGSKFATEWREKVKNYHKERKAKLQFINSMKTGDNFYCYGEPHTFLYKKNTRWCIAKSLSNGKTYRLRTMQVSKTQTPLPE